MPRPLLASVFIDQETSKYKAEDAFSSHDPITHHSRKFNQNQNRTRLRGKTQEGDRYFIRRYNPHLDQQEQTLKDIHQSPNTLLQPHPFEPDSDLDYRQSPVQENRRERKAVHMKPTPHSHDPGYLNALSDYFVQNPVHRTSIEELRLGDDSHSDNEENEMEICRPTKYSVQNKPRDGIKKARCRSRSFHEALPFIKTPANCPISFNTGMVSSPGKECVIHTPPPPPPQPRIPYISKGRRHSYVEPNSKEFHTLSTVFSWVAKSAQDAWPKILGKELDESTEIKTVMSKQLNKDDNAAFESDDNMDSDGCLRSGEVMSWNFSRGIRDPEFTDDSCAQSPMFSSSLPNGSIEDITGFGDFLNARLFSPRNNYCPQNHTKPTQTTLSREICDQQALASDSEAENTEETFDSLIFHEQRSQKGHIKNKFSTDNKVPQSNKGEPLPIELPSFITENYTSQPGRRQRSIELSLLCRTSCNERVLTESPIEFGTPRSTENSMMSPLSFMSGKDSGYMSLSRRFFSPPQQSESEIEACKLERTDTMSSQLLEPKGKVNNNLAFSNVTNGTAGNVESMVDELTVPPRCPENDAHGFDHAENEGPDSIVYANLSNGQCSKDGSRPIVAATVAKLIEKLTHQYGMDQEPGIRHIARVRHFEEDFLYSKSLRFQMESFLKEMRGNPRIQASEVDRRIIFNLWDFYRSQRRDYKTILEVAERKLREEQGGESEQHKGSQIDIQGPKSSDRKHAENYDVRVTEVERLGISSIQTDFGSTANSHSSFEFESSEGRSPSTPTKGRHRASTLAGITSRSMVREAQKVGTTFKSSQLSSEPRAASISRQMSEGEVPMTRGRRLSASSIKTQKHGATWSAKMTMSINKLKQKSEDIYQQIVSSASSPSRNGDSKICVCWTPAYTGITEHHALNTVRSHTTLRPSVFVASVTQALTSTSSSGSGVSAHLSNKSIKRLKSSISLGRSSPVLELSPLPSPTRNQFSSISTRHSRSNSNSSTGYHPNPECPFHAPCLGAVSTDSTKRNQELLEENKFPIYQESLRDDLSDILTRPPLSRSTTSIPSSPAYCPSWITFNHNNSAVPVYKPFILYYRSQQIARQLCLLEQHFLEQIRWDELLEVELTKAGRRNRNKCQFSIGGYVFKTEKKRSGVEASNERSNMLCMWVASEIVSTHPIEDRVRVIEKFIRIAQKCRQYRNYNSLFHLVMGLGSAHLVSLKRTWSRVNSEEMKTLESLQNFILPYSNWGVIRKAMSQVDYQETSEDSPQRLSMQALDSVLISRSNGGTDNSTPNHPSISEYGSSRRQATMNEQGCIPFLGLFVFDLTHISVSSPWYLPQKHSQNDEKSINPQEAAASNSTRLEAPDPKDLPNLIPSAKTIKWFMAFQRRSQKYTFPVDNTLYSKCFLLRVLSDERVRELADSCEQE
ncbi:hypothetical protein BGZ76_009337 [Entomortierella beljakovae]|nr:hypothetical protein BGZ76_009337 [Entomortierella beljakovae]